VWSADSGGGGCVVLEVGVWWKDVVMLRRVAMKIESYKYTIDNITKGVREEEAEKKSDRRPESFRGLLQKFDEYMIKIYSRIVSNIDISG